MVRARLRGQKEAAFGIGQTAQGKKPEFYLPRRSEPVASSGRHMTHRVTPLHGMAVLRVNADDDKLGGEWALGDDRRSGFSGNNL